MNTDNDGGPAFPVIASNGLGHISDGMTLRDWFAGQFLASVVIEDKNVEAREVSRVCYVMADAMLVERTR